MSTQYRTEDDLRAVFRTEAAEVPETVYEPAALPVAPPRTARRRVLPLAAAATVAAVAVPLAFVQAGHRSASPGHHGAAVRLAFTFTVAPVPGWNITPGAIHATYQDAAITKGDNDLFGGDVTLSAPGAFNRSSVKNGEPVTINGRPGYFGDVVPVNSAEPDTVTSGAVFHKVPGEAPVPVTPSSSYSYHPPTTSPKRVPTVAWEIAPNQWATVTLGRGADVRSSELAIARAVQLTPPTPMRLPFRTGWLPDAARSVTEANFYLPPSHNNWFGYLGLGTSPSQLALNEYIAPAAPRAGTPSGCVPDAICQALRATTFTPNLTVNGRPAQYAPRAPGWPRLTVDLGHNVRLDVSGNYSRTELVHVAESLTLASDPNDPGTWLDQTQ